MEIEIFNLHYDVGNYEGKGAVSMDIDSSLKVDRLYLTLMMLCQKLVMDINKALFLLAIRKMIILDVQFNLNNGQLVNYEVTEEN